MRRKGYKWLLLALLFVTFFLELGTRQVYNAILPQLKIDFAAQEVTDARLGGVGSLFSAVFGLMLLASGLCADFFGRKKTIVVGTLLFSAAILGCGFAEGLGLFFVLYGVVNAMGQCCIAPASYSLISQYHDNSTRSTAMAIFQSANYFGIVVCGWAAGLFADSGAGGWRRGFWTFGAAGLLWAALMQRFMRDTPQPAAANDVDRPSVKAAFAALLTKPTAILIAVAFGMFMYANLGLRLWATAFVAREFPECGNASAAFHSLFWLMLGSFIGLFAGARFLDHIGSRRPSIRLEVSAIGLAVCIPPAIWVAGASSLVECCAALTTLGLALGTYEAAHYPAMFDCVEPRYRSATTGMTGCLAFVMGSAGPFTLGLLSERLSMRAAMASLSVFFLAGALILLPAVFKYFKHDYIGDAK